jgi:hypothetical protein
MSLFNPGATATTADVTYLHESGAAFPYAVAVPAGTWTTLLTPATLPAGAYGVWVQTPASEPIVVERSMYANAD